MGRPTLDRHRKFKRLARKIGSKPLARGLLELLWDSANESGDPHFPDALDVEAVCDWDGEEGALCAMLVEMEFVDSVNTGYIVHDFWHHCPDYVRKRRDREQSRKDLGAPIDKSVTGQCPASDRSLSSQCLPNGSTPTPTPTSFSVNPSIRTSLSSASRSLNSPTDPSFGSLAFGCAFRICSRIAL